MMRSAVAALSLALVALMPAHAEPANPHVAAMYTAMQNRDPAKAITEADQVIAAYEAKYRKPGTLYFCGQTPEETLMNMGLAAKRKMNAVGVSQDWCSAHFVKGFAAIDLKQPELAESELRKATEMAPFNAHYLNEYAELFKFRREWQRSYDVFEKAAGLASLYPEVAARKEIEARSLRGMGFTKIELGDLDEAERLFKRSLQVQPNNAAAIGELKYIAQLRAKTK